MAGQLAFKYSKPVKAALNAEWQAMQDLWMAEIVKNAMSIASHAAKKRGTANPLTIEKVQFSTLVSLADGTNGFKDGTNGAMSFKVLEYLDRCATEEGA